MFHIDWTVAEKGFIMINKILLQCDFWAINDEFTLIFNFLSFYVSFIDKSNSILFIVNVIRTYCPTI